ERTDRKGLARAHDGDIDVFDDAVPCPLGRQHGSGERSGIDRLVKHRPQIEHGTVMVFVAVGQHEREDVVGILLEKLGIGHDQFDAGQIGSAKADAAIDDDPFARTRRTEAVRCHVHADFADAAKRHEDKLIPWGFGHGSFYPCSGRTPRELWSPVALPCSGQLWALAVAPKWTSPAVMAMRAPSSSRMISRPAESIVSKM